MNAIILKEPGGIKNLTLTDLPIPTLKEKEVLVKVNAISINPIDIKTRKGQGVFGRIKNETPIILGWDISGSVIETGKDVSKFKNGDLIFGMVNFPGQGKAYAEYVAAPEDHLALKPVTISHQEAAAASLAALTAWQDLVHDAKIKSGQKVLIHAAAGGVGHFAVQIAKNFGAYVFGTASAANADFLKEIGVDRHIDYTKENFKDIVKDADIVLDPIGGQTTIESLTVLKNGGKLISIVGGVNEEVKALAQKRNIDATNDLVQSNGEDMRQLAELLHSGKIKAHISHVFPFTQIADAHKQIETGKTRGKVIVSII